MGDVDDLTVLIDRPVQIGPATGDLDIRLVNRPSIPDRVPCRTGGVDQLGTHIYAASRYTFDLSLLSDEAFLALRSRTSGPKALRCQPGHGHADAPAPLPETVTASVSAASTAAVAGGSGGSP
jgi:hypothetical protein